MQQKKLGKKKAWYLTKLALQATHGLFVVVSGYRDTMILVFYDMICIFCDLYLANRCVPIVPVYLYTPKIF